MKINMKRKITRQFVPSQAQMRLMPAISGNKINGLGETRVRRASPIYWQEPSLTPFGPLMKFFEDNVPEDEELQQTLLETDAIRARKLSAPSAIKQYKSAAQWSELVKALALEQGAVAVGISRLKPEWVIDTFEVPYDHVITIGVAMDFDNLKDAPGIPAIIEVMKQYGQAHLVTNAIASWIRQQGWNAVSYGGSNNIPLLLIPAAIESGLGELGKHGSLISRTHGSLLRLGGLVTDMPLEFDRADSFGLDDMCQNCQICQKHCIPDAIYPEKQMVRGVRKWYVDFDKCLPYFNETTGCGSCLAVCPWSKPGLPEKLVNKIAIKNALRTQRGNQQKH